MSAGEHRRPRTPAVPTETTPKEGPPAAELPAAEALSPTSEVPEPAASEVSLPESAVRGSAADDADGYPGSSAHGGLRADRDRDPSRFRGRRGQDRLRRGRTP